MVGLFMFPLDRFQLSAAEARIADYRLDGGCSHSMGAGS